MDKQARLRYTENVGRRSDGHFTLAGAHFGPFYKIVDQMISANILLIAVLLIGLFLILIEELNTHGQPRM